MQWKKDWDQFWLLMWKHLCLQKKSLKSVVVLLIYPIFFAALLLLMRFVTNSQFVSTPTIYPSFTVSNLSSRLVPPAGSSRWRLAYTPNTILTNRIMIRAVGLIDMVTQPDLAFDTEDALSEHLSAANNVFGGIVFLFNSNTSLPKKIAYKIRLRAEMYADSFRHREMSKKPEWLTDRQYPTMPVIGPRQELDVYGGNEPGYYYEGFLTLQQAVDLSIIKEVNESFDANRFELQLKQYPYPPYIDDNFFVMLEIQLPIFIVVSFLITAQSICKDILLEKENKLKEAMKLMGLKSWIHWSSWFLKCAFFAVTLVIILTALLHLRINDKAILNYTSWQITLIFLLLYSLSLVTFCFAVSTLFTKANTGATVGSVILFLAFLPYYFIDKNLSFGGKLAASLDFNLALAFGCRMISQYETIGVGVQWNNLAKPISIDHNWTMLHVFVMLILDVVLYAIITWYLDAVVPGEFGTPQPYYFPCMKSYWFGYNSAEADGNKSDGDTIGAGGDDSALGLLASDRDERFEKPMADAKVGIKIRGLTKNFRKNGKLAVNNLNIDIYEGNITALLGQNGAGKTTTMFLLTGFLPPTRGDAYINGMNIKYEMEKIRKSLGLCPQHDILFDLLTVREHLTFFAKLKGCAAAEVGSKVSEMIQLLHLEDKADVEAKALSGGLKRKLCVGIALIADSKFVILDEPTSGMDPEARRQTWDILNSQQSGRTIILSTHHMDEADLLGNRIAIMADGQIQCYGSPMFLKNKYGIGYHVTIIKNANCKVDDVNKVIKMYVPEARLETNVGAEVSFTLPKDQSHKFEELFARLEEDKEALGIEGFGASVTTMEEVFLQVGLTAGSALDKKLLDSNETSIIAGGQSSAFGIEFQTETGCRRNCLQIRGLLVKRIVHSLRSWNVVLVPLFVPIAFTLLALLNLIAFRGIKDLPPLSLSLIHFPKPITPYEVVPPPSVRDAEAMKMANCYAHVAGSDGSVIYLNNLSKKNNSMASFLLSIATGSLEQYNAKYLTGATIETGGSPSAKTTITGWFNNAAYHAIAISLSHVTNTLMQYFGEEGYRIETVNHPLPWTRKSRVNDDKQSVAEAQMSFQYIVPCGIYVFVSAFAVLLIKERIVGYKHIQSVCGAKFYNVWFATFLWDFFIFLIPTAAIIVILECVQSPAYTEGSAIWFVLLDFMFCGFSIIPFVYILSFIFQVPSNGYSWIMVILLMSGITATVVPLIVASMKPNAVSALEWVCYITLPNFCFEKALRDIYAFSESRQSCGRSGDQLNQTNSCLLTGDCDLSCKPAADNYAKWEFPGIGRSLFFMALQGIILFLILFLVDTRVISLMLSKKRKALIESDKTNEKIEEGGNELEVSKDSDVVRERARILNTPIADLTKTDLVIMQDLTKVFHEFIAVDKLSLGIPSGECFGLLGVNGAGKTTCFKMLTGELKPSFGNAFVGGNSVWGNIGKVHQDVGYCPQSDALIDQLTVRETLWIFACIRGISNQNRKQVVDNMIDRLMLKDYTSKQIKTLSGGNKRKLSVAIALIGDPAIIFLDEPTTGMDPLTRRILWNTLIAVRNSGKTLVLTSHSMEECEALCTRLAIMVNGRFQCLGSLQHLKAKFSEGYTLIIKVRGTNNAEEVQEKVNQMKSFVAHTFPGSVLKDHHEGLLNYQIYTPNLSWSYIFGTIEKAKNELAIEDYSVSQTTLEQVFISFARMQREPQLQKISWKARLRRTCGCAFLKRIANG